MPRLLDLECNFCGTVYRDIFFMRVPDHIVHEENDDGTPCRGEMEQVLLPRSTHNAEWSDRDAVVVFRKSDGTVSYPMRNDAPTPAGCERVTMRSLRQVESFERQNGVCNEAMHFDRNGRGFDSGDSTPRDSDSARKRREESFLRSWQR